MSGHSKWSTIKRHKAAIDAARGQIFTKLANAISIAVREGASADPETNIRLRLLIDKARSANMPKVNIERAIERAVHHTGGEKLERVIYEGFAPGGVAVIAQGVTDNIQRTSQEVKNVFHTKGGTMGQTHSVAYLFDQVGEIQLEKGEKSQDEIIELALEIGIDDVEEREDRFVLYTKPQLLAQVREVLLEKGYTVKESELAFRPKTNIAVSGDIEKSVIDFLHALEDLQDIHKVYSNADFYSTQT